MPLVEPPYIVGPPLAGGLLPAVACFRLWPASGGGLLPAVACSLAGGLLPAVACSLAGGLGSGDGALAAQDAFDGVFQYVLGTGFGEVG